MALALDLDCALALRTQIEGDETLDEVMKSADENTFFALVIVLLRMLT